MQMDMTTRQISMLIDINKENIVKNMNTLYLKEVLC
jgi:hypothetical protein